MAAFQDPDDRWDLLPAGGRLPLNDALITVRLDGRPTLVLAGAGSELVDPVLWRAVSREGGERRAGALIAEHNRSAAAGRLLDACAALMAACALPGLWHDRSPSLRDSRLWRRTQTRPTA